MSTYNRDKKLFVIKIIINKADGTNKPKIFERNLSAIKAKRLALMLKSTGDKTIILAQKNKK